MRIPGADGYPYAVISGASADSAICGGPGTIRRVLIWAVGAASSKIEVYDGTVAAGTKIADIDGTAVNPAGPPLDIYCKSSVHVKVTDSGDTIRATITYN